MVALLWSAQLGGVRDIRLPSQSKTLQALAELTSQICKSLKSLDLQAGSWSCCDDQTVPSNIWRTICYATLSIQLFTILCEGLVFPLLPTPPGPYPARPPPCSSSSSSPPHPRRPPQPLFLLLALMYAYTYGSMQCATTH